MLKRGGSQEVEPSLAVVGGLERTHKPQSYFQCKQFVQILCLEAYYTINLG